MYKPTLIISCLVAAVASQASVLEYDSYTNYLTDLGHAPATLEDFSGFTTDTDFLNQSVQINGGTLSSTHDPNYAPGGYNVIDTPNYISGGVDGSNYAWSFVNLGYLSINIDFDSPVHAFGAWFNHAAGGDHLAIDLMDGSNVLDTINVSDDGVIFRGFIVSGGQATSAILHGEFDGGINTIENFAMDDINTDPVPEPASLAVLTLAGLAALRRRSNA